MSLSVALLLLLAPLTGPLAAPKQVRWQRIDDLPGTSYRCQPDTPRGANYPDFLGCFRNASARIRALERQKLKSYPVSFCVTKRLVEYYRGKLASVDKKQMIVEGLHGRNGRKNYSYDDEFQYLSKYAEGHFVRTRKKAGYDCHRHNEILIAGSIPLMEQPDRIPLTMMAHYPKECFPVFQNYSADPNNTAALRQIRDAVRQFFWDHHSCDSIARFVLRTMDFSPCMGGPVLYIDSSLPREVEYLSNGMFVGLSEVLGPNLHVWRQPEYMFADWRGDFHKLYGNGFGLAYVFPAAERRPAMSDEEVRQRLKSHFYKAVVYGSWWRSKEFFAEVAAVLPPHRIWMFHGEDLAPVVRPTGGVFFAREFPLRMYCPPIPVHQPRHTLVDDTCLPRQPTKSLPTAQTRCFRQAAKRIKATTFHYRVFPISLCLPAARIGHLHALQGTPQGRQYFDRVNRPSDGQGNVNGSAFAYLEELAASHFARARRAADFDSVFLLEALAAGAAPVHTEVTTTWDPLQQFHQPKECLQHAAGARRPSPTFRQAMFRFLNDYLRCGAMAQFMFRVTGTNPCAAGPILFLDASLAGWPANQLSLMVLIGLKELLGAKVHVWHEPAFIYQGGSIPDIASGPAGGTPEEDIGHHCALEGQMCQCDGVVSIGGPWYWYKVVVHVSMKCANPPEGDPYPSKKKNCYCKIAGHIPRPEPDPNALYLGHFVHVLGADARGEALTRDLVLRRLRQKHYRLVVFGDLLGDPPFYEEVRRHLPPKHVWAVVDGAVWGGDYGVMQFARALSLKHSDCYLWTTTGEPTGHGAKGSGPEEHPAT